LAAFGFVNNIISFILIGAGVRCLRRKYLILCGSTFQVIMIIRSFFYKAALLSGIYILVMVQVLTLVVAIWLTCIIVIYVLLKFVVILTTNLSWTIGLSGMIWC